MTKPQLIATLNQGISFTVFAIVITVAIIIADKL